MLVYFNKNLSIFICVIVLSVFSYNIYGANDPYATKKEAQSNIAEIEEKQKKYLQEKEVLDNKISDISQKVHELETQIDVINDEIEVKEAEVQKLIKKETENKELFTKRMRALYEDDTHSTLELLLSSKNIGDLFYKMDVVEQIAEYDQQVISDIINQKEMVEEAKAALNEKKQEVEAVRAEQQSKQDELEAAAAESQAKYDELEQDKDVFEAMEAAADKQIAQKEAEIRAAAQKYSNLGGVPYNGGKLCMPTTGGINTSSYGPRTHPVTKVVNKMHTGLDIAAPTGTNIYAAEAGTVIVSTYESGYGNYIVVSHGGGMTTLYGHCSARLVSVGQSVTRGQVIGKVGSTGLSTGPHLHFEVRLNGAHTNPLPYIS